MTFTQKLEPKGNAAGKTPNTWNSTKLAKLVNLVYGKSPAELEKFDAGIPIFGTGGISGYTNVALYEGPSVILGRKGTIDKVQRSAGPFWAIDTTFYTTPKQNFDWSWLYYVLSSFDLRKLNEASGVPSLSRGSLEALDVAAPPLQEQKKIAAILAVVDDKLDLIARQIELSQKLKRGLMQTLFSRGLGIQDESGGWVPHSKFNESSLGTLPANWSVIPIGKALKIVERPVAMATDTHYRRVTVKRRYGGVELRDKLPASEIKVKSQFRIEAGDFLISERQIVHGACGIVPENLAGALVSNEYLVLTAQDDGDVRYFSYLVQLLKYAKLFLQCAQGVDIEKFLFKPKDWLTKLVPVPPLAEQQRIVKVLGEVEAKIKALEDRQGHYQSLKRGLMQKLLTGEWRVKPDADMAV